MGKPIADYRMHLRLVLGDDPSGIAPSYTNEQLDSIIKSTVEMGLGPDCLSISDDGLEIEPVPTNNDTAGYLILKAGYMALGGDTPVNVRTRAMQVSVNPNARRDTLHTIEGLIHQLVEKGNICGNTESTTVLIDVDPATFLESAFTTVS